MKLKKYSLRSNETNCTDYLVISPFSVKLSWLNNLTDIFSLNRKLSQYEHFRSEQSDFSLHSSRLSKISSYISQRVFDRASLRSSDLSCQLENSLVHELSLSQNETEAMQVLCKMWLNVVYCDLILVSNGREFLAHRIALALSSPKYKAYFQSKPDFVTRIQLSQHHPKTINSVLNFIYKSDIDLSMKTIEDTIECAIELDVKYLVDECEDFLSKSDKKFCLQALHIAKKFKFKQVYFKIYWQLSSNFDQCIKQSYFMRLSSSLLIDILEDESNRNETYLFKRVLAWIYMNKDRYTSDRLVTVLERINLHKIDINDFDAIINENSFVLQIPECLNLFKRFIK